MGNIPVTARKSSHSTSFAFSLLALLTTSGAARPLNVDDGSCLNNIKCPGDLVCIQGECGYPPPVVDGVNILSTVDGVPPDQLDLLDLLDLLDRPDQLDLDNEHLNQVDRGLKEFPLGGSGGRGRLLRQNCDPISLCDGGIVFG